MKINFKTFISIFLSLILYGSVFSANENKPFPTWSAFTHCLRPYDNNPNKLRDDIKDAYDVWKQRFLKDYPQNDPIPGVKYIEAEWHGYPFEIPQDWVDNNIEPCTQSEATGYGMIIFVLMAGGDGDPDAQEHFNGLLNLYLMFKSSLCMETNMSWVVPEVPEVNNVPLFTSWSATDGDMDIAYACILADRQWGSGGSNPDYLWHAKHIIDNVMRWHDIADDTKRILIGDAYSNLSGGSESDHAGFERYNNTVTRSSDWILDHLRAFKEISEYGDNGQLWQDVIDEVYDLFGEVQDQTTGLVPDFIEDINGVTQPVLIKDLLLPPDFTESKYMFNEDQYDNDYNWNACRLPWRLGTDFAHYENQSTFDVLEKLMNWASSSEGISDDPATFASSVTCGYIVVEPGLNPGEQIPEQSTWHNMAFTAPMVTGFIINPSDHIQEVNEQFLEFGWDEIVSDIKNTSDYFGNSIGLLCLLLMAKAWWNPMEEFQPEPDWVIGKQYNPGDKVTYDEITWECVYTHTSQIDWYPGAPGLWFWQNEVTSSDWKCNVKYNVGDIVSYNNTLWKCIYHHTSQVDWYPGAPGLWFWEETGCHRGH